MASVDPFVRLDRKYLTSRMEMVKIVVVLAVFGPLKLLLSVGPIALYGLALRLTALVLRVDVGEVQQIAGARLVFLSGRYIARFVLFVLGWRVTTTGDAATATAAESQVVVCNHVSMLDILVMFGYAPGGQPPSFVSKAGLLNAPLIGSILLACRPILVARSKPGEGATRLIAARCCCEATPGKKRREPAIAIFPEGTTTNGSALIKFHRGAFVPMVTVKPMAIRYRWKTFSPAYEVIGWKEWALHLYGQLVCGTIEVTFLPAVHPPPAGSGGGPDAFAENVRHTIAEALGVPLVEKTYADKLEVLRLDAKKND
jgi:lysophosphatidylcholine acyltransferase/lyso-PAF acetyltransferase